MTTASTGAQGSRTGAQGTGSEPGQVTAGPGYVSKTDMVAALIREQIITGELAAGRAAAAAGPGPAVPGQPDAGP